jgi:hypothetical protein
VKPQRATVVSRRRMERQVDALLDTCATAGRGAGPPVPVEWIAEHVLDLRIVWDALPTDPAVPVLGGLDPIRGEIVLNEREARRFSAFPGLEAFTLAHEIGHWLLHVPSARRRQPMLPGMARVRIPGCGGAGRATAEREQQADRFAALLLMPARLLLPRCAGLDLTRFPARYRLRDEFGVSISAMNQRLKALGYGWFNEHDEYVSGRRAAPTPGPSPTSEGGETRPRPLKRAPPLPLVGEGVGGWGPLRRVRASA